MSTNPHSPQSSEENRPSKTAKPTNDNGNRSAKGLVVAGLVTVAGSWLGMAAYLDYRLQSVEKITAEAKKEVVSIVDTSQSNLNRELGTINSALSQRIDTSSITMNKKIQTLNDTLSERISDTSSVLAKGILDLTQKSSERYSQTLEAVNEANKTIKQLPNSLKNLNQQSFTEIASLIQQSDSKLESNQAVLVEAIDGVGLKTQKTGDAVLAAVLDVDNNLQDTRSGLLARIEAKAQSLEDLVKVNDTNQADRLSLLASTMSNLSGTQKTGSRQFSTELTALAENVGVLREEIAASHETIRSLGDNIPGWQTASVEKMSALNDTTLAVNESVQNQMTVMQEKLSGLTQVVDNTTASLMKALYQTSEGMEGTRLELKSDLETSKETMSAEIKDLAQTIDRMSETLKELDTQTSQSASHSQSSMLPFAESTEFQSLTTMLDSISDQTFDLRSYLVSHADEADARAKALLDNSEQPEALKVLLEQFAKITDDAGGELDSLIKGLDSLTGVVENLGGQVAQTPSEEASMETDSTADSTPTPTAMNPEDRSDESKEVSLN